MSMFTGIKRISKCKLVTVTIIKNRYEEVFIIDCTTFHE